MSRLPGLLPICAALGLGCASEPAPVPLYPNAQSARLPAEQVAIVEGPIGKIDGQEVASQGGRFELLPGCHLVDLDRQAGNDNFALSTGLYVTGQLQAVTYALRMKPGARYIIRRENIGGDLQTVRIEVSAREELPGGATTDVSPAKSADDIQACKSWAATLAH